MDIDPSAAFEHDRDLPQAITDEELFEAYLSARLGQALETLNCAREELAAQPQDFNRALAVMRRVHELRDLTTQLEMQRDRLNAARTAAGLDTVTDNSQPVAQATPGAAFRAAQAEQADKVMAALTARPRTCPSCQALLEANRAQCGCGYTIETEAAAAEVSIAAQNTPPLSAS